MAEAMICPNCMLASSPVGKRSGAVRTILWVCFIVGFFSFGLLWLVGLVVLFAAPKYRKCPACEASGLVPLNSPRGQTLQQQRVPAAIAAVQ